MNKSKGLTFILSVVPGLGHFYLGLMNRGLQFMILFFSATFFSNILFLFGFVIPIIWFFTLFDALQQHKAIKEQNEFVDEPLIKWGELEDKKYYIGWALIILGGLYLVDQLEPYFDRFVELNFVRSTVIALLLVYVGYRLISGKTIFPGNSRKLLPAPKEKEEKQ